MKEQLESLNSISINFGENGMMIVNILLAFIMFGVALGIKLDTFRQVFRNPRSIITGHLPAVDCPTGRDLPDSHRPEPMDHPHGRPGHDTGGMLPRRQHIQLHFLPFQGECGALRQHDSRNHGIRSPDYPPQLLPLGDPVLQHHQHCRRSSAPSHTFPADALADTTAPGHTYCPGNAVCQVFPQCHQENHQTGADALHPAVPPHGRSLVCPELPAVHRQHRLHILHRPAAQRSRFRHRLRQEPPSAGCR